jgi:hypothetical protein
MADNTIIFFSPFVEETSSAIFFIPWAEATVELPNFITFISSMIYFEKARQS